MTTQTHEVMYMQYQKHPLNVCYMYVKADLETFLSHYVIEDFTTLTVLYGREREERGRKGEREEGREGGRE